MEDYSVVQPGRYEWATVKPGQRLYIARPSDQDWQGALREYWDMSEGGRSREVWVVEPPTYRAGDLLLTYMQTRPVMVVCLEQLLEPAHPSRRLVIDDIAFFKHGISVDSIADSTGIDLVKLDGYLDSADAQRVIDVLAYEYSADIGVFGERP